MAANYNPQVIQKVSSSVGQATGLEVRYQGGAWEYSTGMSGVWSRFDTDGQASLHAQAAKLAIAIAPKTTPTIPVGVFNSATGRYHDPVTNQFLATAPQQQRILQEWQTPINPSSVVQLGSYQAAQMQARYDAANQAAQQAAQRQQAAQQAKDAALQQQQIAQYQRQNPVLFPGAYDPNQVQQAKNSAFSAANLAAHQQQATAAAQAAKDAEDAAAQKAKEQADGKQAAVQMAQRFALHATQAAAAVGYSMHSSAGSASNIAGSLIEGASSVLQNAYEAGSSIASSILAGVLAPFGKTGSAIGSVAKAGMNGIGGVAMAGIGAAGSIAKGAAGVAGAGLALAGAGAGFMVGGGVGLAAGGISAAAGLGMAGPLVAANAALVGMVIGATIVAAIMKAVSGLANMISDVLQSVGKVIGEVGKVISSAIQASIEIIQDVSKAALDQSKSILDLSQKTGLSLATASRAITTGMAFGLGAGDIHPQNPLFGRVQSAIYGGTGDGGESDIRSFRSWFRGMQSQGPMGLLMAQGLTPADKQPYIPAANLSDDVFNRQLNRSKGLEMDPGQVERVGQGFKGLLDTVAMLATNVKTTLLDALMPALTDGLSAVIDYWMKNKEQIIDTLWGIGRFMYVDFPVMVIKGLQFLNDGALQFVQDMAKGAQYVAGTMQALGNMFEAFSKGEPTFLDNVGGVLKGLDYLSSAFNGFMKVLAAVGYVAWDLVAMSVNIPSQIATSLLNAPAALLKFLGLDGLASKIPTANLPKMPYLDLHDLSAWDTGSDMYGSFQAFRNGQAPMSAASGLKAGANALNSAANGASGWAQGQHDAFGNILNNAAAAVAGNGAKYDAYQDKVNAERTANATERTAAASEKTANASEKQISAMMSMFERVIARSAAYQAEDAYLNLGRI